MAGSGFTIFNDGNFRIGLGDANRDGRLDLDFGLRGQAYGNGPWGGGHQGFEVGLNTQRGVYAGGDYSNYNAYGQQSGFGRVFGDGGFEAGGQSSDIFGNYNQNYTNSSPWSYYQGDAGGNLYTGNYYGNQTQVSPFGYSQDSVVGNTWSGAQFGQHSYGNGWGGGSYNTYNPGYVPNYGFNNYHQGGCGCASRFLGY